MPRYRQIALQLRQGMMSGELAVGARLPSSRTLAQELGVSRDTIENAYGELVAQGWLERRGQSGTFVSHTPPGVRSRATTSPLSAHQQPQPFQMGLPALDAFPRALWGRLLGRRQRSQTGFDLAIPEPGGELSLRQAIAEYLRYSRNIDCSAEHIFITAGYAQALRLLLGVLATPQQGIWLEDPGYPLVRPILAEAGLRFCPVPVDSDGMDIAFGRKHFPDARFALVTPAHQSPLGVALSADRRRQLLEWAARCGSWIIEDDYDSEFRYHARPLPPVKSLDGPQRVIYAGTFSKSLFPALRTAWLVVPPALATAFQQAISRFPCTVPTLIQQTIGDFIHGGHFFRHLKKMRQLYGLRHENVTQALAEQGFRVAPQSGGIQLVIEVDEDDVLLAQKANRAGLAVQALTTWCSREPARRGLLLCFTNVASLSEARRLAKRLRDAISL
ncbi:PLP-dependent aminotransferase family protein [Entomohabitans teleogrylli]|uniref:MocR-like pyridoxine biosynthesis transcription factor PdxR n=1 Tax=Entomohabitans teleogrylli TaxID=1384589 RepID=UPI00073D334E|nr:PLP-dependent aminotransferase family protein [Entomohabitans teleogrylli]